MGVFDSVSSLANKGTSLNQSVIKGCSGKDCLNIHGVSNFLTCLLRPLRKREYG